jgi:hypothetical protein
MPTTKKISIGVGLLVLLVTTVFLLMSYVLSPQVVSRVPVPGSSMTAIVTDDLSGCYSVRLFEHGQPISGFQLLGPFVSQHCSLSQVSAMSNIVTIDWTDEGNRYRTAVDIAARRFVAYSNGVPVR